MDTTTEAHLRELFQEDASRAPINVGIGAQVLARARRERRRRAVAFGGGAVLIAVTVGVGGAGTDLLRQGDASKIAVADAGSLALPDAGMSDCRPPQSGADIAKQGFAFDGTVDRVVGIASPDASPISFASVTFTVHEWFKGGDGMTSTVVMAAPLKPGQIQGDAGPSYQPGTRLLVSGSRGEGDALHAWGCGYTRYFNATTGGYWRSATR